MSEVKGSKDKAPAAPPKKQPQLSPVETAVIRRLDRLVSAAESIEQHTKQIKTHVAWFWWLLIGIPLCFLLFVVVVVTASRQFGL